MYELIAEIEEEINIVKLANELSRKAEKELKPWWGKKRTTIKEQKNKGGKNDE